MAKDAISKIEKAEKACDDLIKSEKDRLKLKLKEVKKKADDAIENERKKNITIYNKVVEEFKVCVDKKNAEFNKKIDEQCNKLEVDFKKNVSKAAEFVLMKILKN